MKKLILFFSFLFVVSSSFMSCRNEEKSEVLDNDLETFDEDYNDDVATTDFDGFDRDGDGLWDANEFGESYDADWTEWDVDNDGYLNDGEFYSYTFGWIDSDDDDLIDEDEWNEGYNNLYRDYAAVGDFTEYDLDDDGFLDEDEWYEGWGDSTWYNDYDLNDDNLVDTNEWNEGIFGNWDEDGDGFWNEDEYNRYSVYYDTW